MEVSRRLGAYSDTTLEELTRLLVPELAACCQFHLLDEQGIARTVASTPNGSSSGCASSSDALAKALGSGAIQLGPAESSDSADYHMVVPLCVSGRVLGALTLGWRSEPEPERVRSAELLGRSVALAVDRARLERAAGESLAVREQFLSAVSHALRSPLATLRLQLQVGLRRLTQGEAPTTTVLEKALVQTDRLNLLVSDLVDASRIEAGGLVLERQPVELRALLLEVAQVFGQHYPGRQLDVVAAEPMPVTGDRRRLGQVLSQLLDNAAKFSAEDTVIQMTTAIRDDELVVSVADEGIGIPPGERVQVFERFFRASNANTQNSHGVGLGLYIGRAIVAGHAGRMWVESEPGRGSIFRVVLPLDRATSRETAQRP